MADSAFIEKHEKKIIVFSTSINLKPCVIDHAKIFEYFKLVLDKRVFATKKKFIIFFFLVCQPLELTITPEQEELKQKAMEYQKQQEAIAAEAKVRHPMKNFYWNSSVLKLAVEFD